MSSHRRVFPVMLLAAALMGFGLSACSTKEAAPGGDPSQSPTDDTREEQAGIAAGKDQHVTERPKARDLPPVRGQVSVETVSQDSSAILGLGSTRAPNGQQIDPVTRAIRDWLNGHLTKLQRTGRGRLGAVAASGLPRNADQRARITTALAHPDRPVASATYEMTAYHVGGPREVAVQVRVEDVHGGTHGAQLLFDVNSNGEPTLVAYGNPRGPSVRLPEGDPYVLLVMGSDQGPYRPGNVMQGRADQVQLVVVDGSRTRVSIVSFPRDTWVNVAGQGNSKINTLLLPGPAQAMQTMQNVTGLEVDDWIVTGFSSFRDGVDGFGGVNVNVQHHLTNTTTGSGADEVVLAPGRQLLSGRQALGFVRDRKSRPGGDIGRSAAGATMLRALHSDLLGRADSPRAMARFTGVLRANSRSSISTRRMAQLRGTALRIDPANVAQTTIPVSIGSVGAQSVVFMQSGAESIFAQLRNHGSLDVLR